MRFAIPLLAATSLFAANEAAPVTFVRDVAPVLAKAGCMSGTCHGAAKGKNGFKLSLRGYDPQFDYEALLYDLGGRRFNRADPGRSLMLTKPTQQVAHGGGLRFEINSDYYKIIYNWIAQGVPFGDPAKDGVKSLDVEPKDILMEKPGGTASVKVVATFNDGGTRDVTREANIDSNVPDVATVGDHADIRGARIGEATLLVRYQGKFTSVPVTVLNPAPGFAWKQLPQNNFIDQLIDAKLQRLKIQPSGLVDDAGFLRRVSLDLTGQLPEPNEIRAFVADPTPTKLKRSRLIDKLIGNSAFIDHWTLKWGDLLQANRKYLGEKGVYEFDEWIRESFTANKPYDKMVREILSATGSSNQNPAANFFRVTRDPKPTMEKTTQVFLGVRMVCAQCHDHPFERWTQNQYYEMSAFYSALGIRPGYEVGEEIVYNQRADFDMKHPKDGRVMKPAFIVPASYGATPGNAGPVPSDSHRRMALAEWVTARDNPFFAKSTVNRVWSYFFGRGIIDPVDDIRASNPPSNPALLDALTKDFLDHNFDLRQLMRTITNSRTYQASLVTNEWNAGDVDNFSHAAPRRLAAEELLDALTLATGVRPDLPEVPPDTRAEQLPDPHVGKDGFLDLFGRPSRESSCECERRSDISLPQALNLVNGQTISDAVAGGNGRVAKAILSGKSDRDLVEEFYLASFSRMPTPAESEQAVKYLSSGTRGRAALAQDLLWALVNSKPFLYNY
ncbi:MAG TPA: DUF1549 and DUF1553 domain-containing protein [Bryobacteraceae bacterium]|nr:DUF1549 and DUF1553 domain-containing protein [Bryobacteraceae bacterium]